MKCHETKEEKGCCNDLKKQKMENNQESKKPKSKKWIFLTVGLGIVFLTVFLFFGDSKASGFATINSIEEEINIYKSLTCGCCSVYTDYVDGKVIPKVNSFNVQDPDAIKEQYGIPRELQSCHTTIIENYFVEGHIPLEAVEKLMKEQPNIKGIAMPGMPSGSPGMPGGKTGDFIIYSVNNDESYEEFMRI